MVRAKLISTEGPYLEAIIEHQGQRLCVMDEFSVCEASAPKVGTEIEFEFDPFIDEDESWESIFSGNPEGRIGLEQLSGWRYRAFGKVISVNPVVVDCGLLRTEGVVSSSDPRLIGEPVAFIITRLSGYAYAVS
jgi:hypothetical protein